MKVLLITLLLVLSQSNCFVNEETRTQALVLYVSDGDSIVVRFNNSDEKQRVRLATIDAPELKQSFGLESKESLAKLIGRKTVSLNVMGVDKYGRQIAEVYLADLNINQAQVENGMAWYYRYHSDEISWESRRSYLNAEEAAKDNQVGLWSKEDPMPPWVFRKKQK